MQFFLIIALLSLGIYLINVVINGVNSNYIIDKEIKALNPKKESLPLSVGGTSGESNIANLRKDHFSAIATSAGSTDNRDQVMNALRTVIGHNDVVNVHQLRQIVKGVKNNKAVGNVGIQSEVYKFASERLLTMMSIFLSGCMLAGKLPTLKKLFGSN